MFLPFGLYKIQVEIDMKNVTPTKLELFSFFFSLRKKKKKGSGGGEVRKRINRKKGGKEKKHKSTTEKKKARIIKTVYLHHLVLFTYNSVRYHELFQELQTLAQRSICKIITI